MTNDASIRKVLIAYLIDKHKDDYEKRILEELCVNNGSCRVDIAVVNGILHGYEIKSDADTLDRLKEQVKSYSEVFDKTTIVVGTKYIINVIEIVPEWWGIILAKQNLNGVRLYQIREDGNNPQCDKLAVAKLLWREEALSILDDIGAAVGVRSKRRNLIYARLVNQLNHATIRDKVCDAILSRQDWRVDPAQQICGD